MTEQTIPYPSWSITVTFTHDSTMCTSYKDEGIGFQELLRSIGRCEHDLKAFYFSLIPGEKE